MPAIHPLKEVIINNPANQILIKRKDGIIKIMELKNIAGFLKKHIPNKPLIQDTFAKNCK